MSLHCKLVPVQYGDYDYGLYLAARERTETFRFHGVGGEWCMVGREWLEWHCWVCHNLNPV